MLKRYLSVILLSLVTTTIYGAIISVTNANDSGTGSLRQALTTAVDGDLILIGVAGPITLQSDLPLITKAITVTGLSSGTTISGNSLFRVFSIQLATGTATFSNLHVKNAFSSNGAAPGLFAITGNNAQIIITRCTFSGCVNTGSQSFGGAVATGANMLISNSTFYNNTAEMGGGALATLSDITLSINATTFYNNKSTSQLGGGGIDLAVNSVLNIQNSIVAGNSSGLAGIPSDIIATGGATVLSLGNNLSNTAPFGHASDLVNKNLDTQIKLVSLTHRGAMVCPVESGSVAINAANNSTAPPTDQRMQSRIGNPDIGSYEFVPLLSIAPTTATLAVTANSNIQVEVTSNSSWTVSGIPTWLEASALGGFGNASVILTALTANHSGASRSVTITFSSLNVTDQTITITQEHGFPTLIEQANMNVVLNIYPNPCSDGFYVEVGHASTELQILDLEGRVVLSKMVSGTSYVPVRNLKPGLYVVKVLGKTVKLMVAR